METRKWLTVVWVGLCWLAASGGTAMAEEDDPVLAEKPLATWLQQLRSMRRGDQLRAAQTLSEAPEALRPGIVPKLIPVLQSDRENDRFVAAQVLGNYGPIAKPAVPELLPLLKGTQYERNRAAAAKALGQILMDAPPSDETEKVTADLIAGFSDIYEDVRRESVSACGMIGPAAKACLTHMAGPFSEPDTMGGGGFPVRNAAAWTCGRMGPLAAVHIDRLIAQMHRDSKSWVSMQSPVMAEAIGRIGSVNDNVVPNLVDTMETRGKWREKPPDDPIIPFFSEAVNTLALFGPKAAPAVPYLTKLAREGAKPSVKGDVALLVKVVKALGAIGPAAAEAVPELEKLRSFRTGNGPELKALEKELISEVDKALAAIGVK